MIRLAVLPLISLAACSPEPAESPEPAAIKTRAEPSIPADPAPDSIAGRAHRYTALTGCQLVREERDEMPYTETLCAGPAGWALRIADSDARQALSVVAPDNRETRIDLARVSGGAFNSFGETAEWRGPSAEPFAPDSLIVRFSVAEEPHPAPEVSYLLAIRLAPTPCLVSRVPPGLTQNDTTRAAADGGQQCRDEVR